MKFPILYCDPPWRYRDAGGRGSAESHYETMSCFEIAVVLDRFAEADCVLFLWCVPPAIEECLATPTMCGFVKRTLGFEWIKLTKTGRSLHWGMGHWTRSNPEPCYIFTRGTDFLRPVRHDVHSVVTAPVMAHSQKPPEVRHRIDRLMVEPGEPVDRIELFARERPIGWSTWGDGVDDQLRVLPPPEVSCAAE